MKRELLTLLTAGAVSAVALTGGTAFAKGDGNDHAEVLAFLAAKQDITVAISAAEAATGGTAVAAEFDAQKGVSTYEIDLIAKDRQVSVRIDANTGQVISNRDKGDVAKADEDEVVDPAQLGAPLAQLVAKAHQNGSAKVMAIDAEHEGAQAAVIKVELANTDGTTHEFVMAADGSMTKVGDDQDNEHGGTGEEAESGEQAN